MLTPGEVSGKHTPAARMGRLGRGLLGVDGGPGLHSSARTLPDELLPKRNPASPGIVNFQRTPEMSVAKRFGNLACGRLGPLAQRRGSFWHARCLRSGPQGSGEARGAGRDTASTASRAAGAEGTRSVGCLRRQHLRSPGNWGGGPAGKPCLGQQFAERSPWDPLS